MQNHLPSGKLHFVGGWQPQDDPDIVVLIWETKSITPEIESSLFTGEVIRATELIEVLNSGSLERLHELLRNRYGVPEHLAVADETFAAAACCMGELAS